MPNAVCEKVLLKCAHGLTRYRRQDGQAAPAEVKKKDLRALVEEKERMHFAKARGVNFEGG
jgi:hypothetical protein